MNMSNGITLEVILGGALPIYISLRLFVASMGYNMPSIPIPLRSESLKGAAIFLIGFVFGLFMLTTAIMWFLVAVGVQLLHFMGICSFNCLDFYGSIFEGLTSDEKVIREELRSKILAKKILVK